MTKLDVTRAHVVIDGFNVLHAVLLAADRREAAALKSSSQDRPAPEPLNWWEHGYQRRVVAWAEALWLTVMRTRAVAGEQGLADSQPIRLTVVFDASREVTIEQRVMSERVAVVYAPSADEWIVEQCRKESVVVITADRALVNRARMWGARSVKPWAVNEEWGSAEPA